ncbi:transcription cofactor vestigial-like protein 2b [Lampris incognitus]|uniref:transcription cofactor vestigial-like protein 2b n=1 Tax=Lampris incognitus TaxID=2546036 RepID=UPI0024B61556|nr:transcription cofactor vestigial-like protein 2b [Lampris incognitus]
MSCLDVMYPAYGHYAPYAPTAHAFISSLQAPRLSSASPHHRDFMDAPRGPEGVSGGPSAGGPVPGGSSSSSSSSSSSYPPAASRQDEGPKEKREAPEAEYLTSRCVLFTYYHGDISSVVDEHFSRALSSYMDGEGKRRVADQQGADTPSPGSRRSFPPSFWDSNYSSPQSHSHCETGAPAYSMDPYGSGLHPGLPHPHPHAHPHAHPHSHPHPSESWGYPQTQAYGPPRPLHELYSPSALEPHYGPLLMPAVRPPHLPTLPGHYEVSKLEPSPSWPSLLPPGDVSQSLALNMDAGLQHHKKGKELYWF